MPTKIHIPKPCHESWEAMSKNERGAFCQSCQKNVVDFTGKSDLEVLRMVGKDKSLCGRFTEDQLNRPLEQPATLPQRYGRAAALFAGLSFGSPAIAQQVVEKDSTEQHEPSFHYSIIDSLRRSKDTLYINGKITDQDGNPSLGVHIIESNTKIATVPSFEGLYKLKIPAEKVNHLDSLQIETSSEAYIPMKFQVPKQSMVLHIQPTIRADLKCVTVTVGGAFVYRPSLWQRFLNLFRKKENRR